MIRAVVARVVTRRPTVLPYRIDERGAAVVVMVMGKREGATNGHAPGQLPRPLGLPTTIGSHRVEDMEDRHDPDRNQSPSMGGCLPRYTAAVGKSHNVARKKKGVLVVAVEEEVRKEGTEESIRIDLAHTPRGHLLDQNKIPIQGSGAKS